MRTPPVSNGIATWCTPLPEYPSTKPHLPVNTHLALHTRVILPCPVRRAHARHTRGCQHRSTLPRTRYRQREGMKVLTPMAQDRSSKIISIIEWIWTSRLSIKKSFSGTRACNPADSMARRHPGGNPGANRWFLQSTLVEMPPESGGICGRLT